MKQRSGILETPLRNIVQASGTTHVDEAAVREVTGYAPVVRVHLALYGNRLNLTHIVIATNQVIDGIIQAACREVVDYHLTSLRIPVVAVRMARIDRTVVEDGRQVHMLRRHVEVIALTG